MAGLMGFQKLVSWMRRISRAKLMYQDCTSVSGKRNAAYGILNSAIHPSGVIEVALSQTASQLLSSPLGPNLKSTCTPEVVTMKPRALIPLR